MQKEVVKPILNEVYVKDKLIKRLTGQLEYLKKHYKMQ